VIKRISLLVTAALLVLALSAPVALAAQELPDGCIKDNTTKGEVICTTTDLPGNSDLNGKGKQPKTDVTDSTQGNLTNKSPEPQNLKDNVCDPDASVGLCKQAER